MPGFNMDDYVPVNERIEAFYAKYPDGSIQSEIVELTDSRVTVKAFAYRHPEDPRPGTGVSSENIPGSTSFTRDSEVENAETSAWGRAIAALGFEVKRGIASREEMRNKSQDGERASASGGNRSKPATTRPAAPRNRGEALGWLAEVAKAHGLSFAAVETKAKALGIDRGEASVQEIVDLIAAIETPDGVPTVAAGGGDGSSALPAADNATSDAGTSDAATPAGVDSPLPQPVAPNDLMDDIIAITGGELVPPKKGTPEYAALPDGTARAKARAYWEAHSEPEPETLAEQLRTDAVA